MRNRADPMRIMALDYGSKTVGVALSDELFITAAPHCIIRRERENKLRKTLSRIEDIIIEYNVGKILLGLPVNMDDSIGDRAEKTREFAELLRNRTDLPIIFWDERLTTVEAIDIMDEAGIKRENRKDYVDSIAASIILRDYLNANHQLNDTH